MNTAYKFRIYPTAEQEVLIQKTFGCCRFVYNYFLAERIRVYEENKKTLNYYDCAKALTDLKKNDQFSWLKEIDIRTLQCSLRDLETAYKRFFNKVGNSKYPKFKSKKTTRKSFRTNNGNSDTAIVVSEKAIKLPKLGLVKCNISKSVQGRILNAR